MMSDFIPVADSKFCFWARRLVEALISEPDTYGLSPDALAKLESEAVAFDSSLSDLVRQRNAARAATVRKNSTRKKLENTVRTCIRVIQANSNITLAQKAAAGLPVRSPDSRPAEMPSSPPGVSIRRPNVLQNQIRFFDINSPNRRKKPEAVMGCDIIAFIGQCEPEQLKDFRSLGLAPRMTHTVNFNLSDGGKSVWYRFRWIGKHGQLGSWSNQVRAPIDK